MARLIKIDPNSPREETIKGAVRIIKDGGLVAFPTETVYGLGADALNEEAVRRIFEVKGRPSPTKASQVAKDLGERIDLLLDGGETEIGVESTILDLTTSPLTILREGALKREEIEEVVGKIL